MIIKRTAGTENEVPEEPTLNTEPWGPADPYNYLPYSNQVLDKYRVILRQVKEYRDQCYTVTEREENLLRYRAELIRHLVRQDAQNALPPRWASAWVYEKEHFQEFVELLIALNTEYKGGEYFTYKAALAEVAILSTAFEDRLSLAQLYPQSPIGQEK